MTIRIILKPSPMSNLWVRYAESKLNACIAMIWLATALSFQRIEDDQGNLVVKHDKCEAFSITGSSLSSGDWDLSYKTTLQR